MNVLIDGYALSIRNGSGLTTHAREMVKAHTRSGISQSALFGTETFLYSRDRSLYDSKFIQKLLNGEKRGLGELGIENAMLVAAAFNFLRGAIPFGMSPQLITLAREEFPADSFVDFSQFDHVYNQNRLFDSAFAIAGSLGSAINVSLGEHARRYDVFHTTSPVPVRIRNIPKIVTVHDVIPLAFPQATSINLSAFKKMVAASIEGAEAICVVSELARKQLQRYFNVPEEKIFLTYQSVDLSSEIEQMTEIGSKTLLSRVGVRPDSYLFYTGAIEPKKNVSRLLHAYASADIKLPLVIAGPPGWDSERDEEAIAQVSKFKKVIRLSYLPRQDQIALMANARGLVFPSLVEGFGLPVLEAMTLGVPVLTSNMPPTSEIAGESAILVDPYSVADIQRGLELFSDDETCIELGVRGKERSKTFSPEAYAERLELVYNSVR